MFQVKAKGQAPALEAVVAMRDVDGISLTVGPARTMSGKVVNSKGEPVTGAMIVIDSWRGTRALGVFLITDNQGVFRWKDAPPDSVQINVNRVGFDAVHRRAVSPEHGEIVVGLKRSISISGSVVDAQTNKRIQQQIQVDVGVADLETGAIRWGPGNQVFAHQGRLQANVDVERTPEFRLRIKSKGYATIESRLFRADEGQVAYDVRLAKSDKPEGTIVSGVVRGNDGKALVGAEVAVTYPISGGRNRLPHVQLKDGKIQANELLNVVKTEADGSFSLTREPDPEGQYFAVIVAHPDAYAEVGRAGFEAEPTIVAQPWGRIEGRATVRGKPVPGASVQYFADRLGNPDVPYLSDRGQVKVDDQGRFVVERVVPGDVRLSGGFREGTNGTAWSNGTLVEVRSGETARAEFGGNGRPVIAKIVPPAGFDPNADYTIHSEFQIESDRPRIPYPKDLRAKRDQSMIWWAKAWWSSVEGHEYRRNWFGFAQAKLQPDGTLRAEDVPPGEYRLLLRYSAERIYGPAAPERTATATVQFTIPPIAGGVSDDPFDLGVLHPRLKHAFKGGQRVPSFEVETLDGRKVKLEDFRGKYLVLEFWATWCGPCVAEIPELKAVQKRFGNDDRFAMLSLSLDADKAAPRKFAAAQGLAWTQGFLGEWVEGGVASTFHVESIPAVFLIDPEGKLVSTGLHGSTLAPAVSEALKSRQ